MIYGLISDICISMKAADYLEMPECIYNRVEVVLSEKEMALYEQLERDMLLPFSDGDIDAVNAAALSNKLLQMADGAVYDENGNVKHIHDRKLEALEDLVEAANGDHRGTPRPPDPVAGICFPARRGHAAFCPHPAAGAAGGAVPGDPPFPHGGSHRYSRRHHRPAYGADSAAVRGRAEGQGGVGVRRLPEPVCGRGRGAARSEERRVGKECAA